MHPSLGSIQYLPVEHNVNEINKNEGTRMKGIWKELPFELNAGPCNVIVGLLSSCPLVVRFTINFVQEMIESFFQYKVKNSTPRAITIAGVNDLMQEFFLSGKVGKSDRYPLTRGPEYDLMNTTSDALSVSYQKTNRS